MPLKGFRCPPSVKSAGRENEPSFCIHECEHQCLPTAVLATIKLTHDVNPHKGDMLSATSLPRCPRKFKLTRTEDYYEEPRKVYDATRGTLIHGFLEGGKTDGVSAETRLYKTITTGRFAPWTISGQIDFYDHKRRRLEDYKTMADKGTYIIYRDGYKEDHALQLNIYRWLMWGGRVGGVDGEEVFWPVDDAVIHYMFMNRVISTGRKVIEIFSERNSPNYGRPYGCEVKRKNAGNNLNGTPQWHVLFNMPKIPLMPFEEVESYITMMGPPLLRGMRELEYYPPGVRSTPGSEWECEWCPVKRRCDEIEEEQRLGAIEAAGEQLDLYDSAGEIGLPEASDLSGPETAELPL